MAVLAAGVVLAGCSSKKSSAGGPAGEVLSAMPPAAFDTTANAISFAQFASAPNVVAFGIGPATIFSIGNGTCPVVTQDAGGTKTTIEGGCTDVDGVTYAGTIVATGNDTNSTYTYDHFTSASVSSCAGGTYQNNLDVDGVFKLAGAGFTSNIVIDSTATQGTSCAVSQVRIAFDYRGTVVGSGPDTDMDGSPDASDYDGSGRVGFDIVSGATVPGLGVVDAVTAGETLNDIACQDEALDGTTTIRADAHTAVFTYDGAADCDTSGTVTWTYDGTPRGEISGVNCDVGGLDGSTAASAIGVVGALTGLLALRRARRH